MLAAPFYVAAGLLVASGVAKLVRPAAAVAALSAARLRGGAAAARGLGVVEIAVGVLALWRPVAPVAAAAAALYLAFALFLVALIRRGDASTCGCFASNDAPPSWLHVSLDLAAFVVALAVVGWPVPSIGAAIADSPFGGVPLVIGLIGAAGLLAVAAAEVPTAWRSYRPDHDEGHGAAPVPPGPRPIALLPERPA
jgi:hypothetical protein